MADPDRARHNIPDHLHQDGRAANQAFADGEKFYRRIPPIIDLPSGAVPIEAFESCNNSGLRQQYTHAPEDVLYNSAGPQHHFSFGILEVQIAGVEAFSHYIEEQGG